MVQGDGPLRGGVRTGQDNPVTLRPFRVQNATCPSRWDPSTDRLAVGYDISDPNHRIRSGRIRYVVTTANREVTIHRQRLAPSQCQHGRCYELSAGERWDGAITEGLNGRDGTENRIGQKVTADLSPIGVLVEVWNTTNPEPGARVRGGNGRTQVPGEWYSSSTAVTDIDAIARAQWDREWVIPFDDPDEPDKGVACMKVEVRNVREGTPVRFEVYRIGEIPDPGTDNPYVDTSYGPEDQPGLQNAVVRNRRVVREGGAPPPRPRGRRRQGPHVPPGNQPYVRFNQYDEHWKYPGNNFYAFRVAFGEHGLSMAASERNHIDRRSACLHMRFTVFIHCPPGDQDYVGSANELHRFFRNDTQYFRSYLKSGALGAAARWVRYYSHRYIVIVAGHAAAKCRYPTHPMQGSGSRRDFIDMHHRGFTPDQNRCPTQLETTAEARRDLEWEKRHYRRATFQGCDQKSHVGHAMEIGRGRHRLFFGNFPGDANRDALCFLTPPARRGASWERQNLPMERREPRLLFYCGGCRTMLTTNLGEYFTRNETKYFHGWTYSVWISENRVFAKRFFQRWIKGTTDDPAPTEYDLQRFVRAYRDVAGGPGITSHPRFMDVSGMLNARPAPGTTRGAMR